MTSRRVLITGGAGFLGSHLCDRFIAEGYEVFCIDTKSGATLWTEPLPAGGDGGGRRGRGGYGSIVAAGPVLFALTPAGQLVVFEPDRTTLRWSPLIPWPRAALTPTPSSPVTASTSKITTP